MRLHFDSNNLTFGRLRQMLDDLHNAGVDDGAHVRFVERDGDWCATGMTSDVQLQGIVHADYSKFEVVFS